MRSTADFLDAMCSHNNKKVKIVTTKLARERHNDCTVCKFGLGQILPTTWCRHSPDVTAEFWKDLVHKDGELADAEHVNQTVHV